MKHMKVTIAFVFVIAVAVSAILGYVNSLTFKSIDQVVAKEFGSMRGKHNAMDDGMFLATQKQVTNKYDYKWKAIADIMRKSGASDAEIRGVLATARKDLFIRGSYTHFTYGVPVKVKRLWVRFQPVWVIQFCWGCGWEDQKRGLTESPTHIRVLAIQARKPYKLLGMQTCS